MKARQALIQQHAALDSARRSADLTSKSLDDNSARILRNGLFVVGFSTLEGFLRSNTAEVLATVTGDQIQFSDLPDPLRKATTLSALRAIETKRRWVSGETADQIAFIQESVKAVASTATSAYSLSPFAFAHERSNVSAEDVAMILKAVGVNAPWDEMHEIARRTGWGGLELKAQYATALAQRNRAAHDPETDTSLPQLEELAWLVLAISISFDALLVNSIRGILRRKPIPKPARDSVTVRSVEKRPRRWAEHVEGHKRAVRVAQDFNEVWTGAVERARVAGDLLVALDSKHLPTQWTMP